MENMPKVCVTGGSGYLGSWLIKKLLEKGYTVHATLRNLGDESKTSLLKSLPNAENNLKLFKADIYNPEEFEAAIQDCQYVLHLATPFLHAPNSKYKDTTEAAVAGVRSIADSCLRSKTVKRLIYTSSVFAASPSIEDGWGFKSQMDESCWTPFNNKFSYNSEFVQDYVKSKTSSDKAILSYNDLETNSDGDEHRDRLEVVSLACGLVGGETILSSPSGSGAVILSQLTSNEYGVQTLRLMQEMLGSIPLVHIDDVCEAHVFCMEKLSLKGRFLCAAETTTVEEIAEFYQRIYPLVQIPQEYKSGPDGRCKCDLSKLRKEGFEYKHGLEEALEDTLKCAKRLGLLN